MPDKKDVKPSETPTETAMSREELEENDACMFDLLWNGEFDGDVFDGDPADLFF